MRKADHLKQQRLGHFDIIYFPSVGGTGPQTVKI